MGVYRDMSEHQGQYQGRFENNFKVLVFWINRYIIFVKP